MAWRCSGSSNAELIDNLFNANIIRSERVRSAMTATDRKFYVADQADAYQDCPQSIGHQATISAPHMHAHALEYLVNHLRPGARVLDVGCGSGYLVGILHELVQPGGKVVGIDHIKALTDLSLANLRRDKHAATLESEEISIVTGDGRQGCATEAPYDVIHVGAAASQLPEALVKQLKPGGRLFIPLGTTEQDVWCIDKDGAGQINKRKLFGVRYVPLTDAPAES